MSSVEIKRGRPADQQAIYELYRALSPRAQRLRFFRAVSDKELRERARLEGKSNEISLMAFEEGRLLGEARCTIVPDEVPEFAVVVANDAQGKGVGRGLVRAMLDLAKKYDVPSLCGILRKENPEMLRLARRIGTLISAPVDDGDVTFDLATGSGMPPWPDRPSRGRVLVEARTLLDSPVVTALWDAGYEVRRCLGPPKPEDKVCPYVTGGSCLAAEGADAMAIRPPADDPELTALLQERAEHDDKIVAVSRQAWGDFVRRACSPSFSLPRRRAY